MDITFLVPYKGLAGGLKVVAVYGNALMRRGHHVTVAYPKRVLPARQVLRRKFNRLIKKERDHLDAFKGRLLEVPAMEKAYIPPGDAVIATSWQTAYWAASLPRECGKGFYLIQGYEKILSHDSQAAEIDASFSLPLTKIVISRWLKETIEKESGVRDIPLIPNGRDFTLSEYEGEGLTRTYDVGMVYSNMGFKAASDGLAAFRMVMEKKPDLTISMFGSDGIIYDRYGDFPFDRVAFHLKPPQERIRDIYLSTRIWISPSLLEGFCLPALEAMSLGCVMIAANSKGVEDIIDDGVDGFLVEPGKPEAMADKILLVMEDTALERRLAAAGLRKSERFSWEASTDMLEKLLTAHAPWKEADEP